MKTHSPLRRALFAALLLVVLGWVVTFTSPASQAIPYRTGCTYYSDATYTVVVGEYGWDCCNNFKNWGTKTQYSICGGCLICYPPPRW